MTEELRGVITGIIFRNDENGYTVFTIENEEAEEEVGFGTFASLRIGETVALFGNYTEHAVYGRQFRALRYEIRMPEDAVSIRRYLSSGAVKGVGEVLAARIVKEFGDDTLRVMREEPELLSRVKGISERKAREIGAAVMEQEETRQAMLFLTEYGISLTAGLKIFREYGEAMYGILRENPYRIADEVEGIGFRIADEIAGKLGIRKDDTFRIRAGFLFLFTEGAQEGNLYLPKDRLLSRAESLLSVPEEILQHVLDDLVIERRVVQKNGKEAGEETRYYHAYYYRIETESAAMLLSLSGIVEKEGRHLAEMIGAASSDTKQKLEEEQKQAVSFAARYGVSIITGGPGTGKTTTIRQIIHLFARENLKIALAAPTGRAAKRMTETTGLEASTIHRLLEVEAGEKEDTPSRYGKNAEDPLLFDVVIVDEMSMVDAPLFHALLSALTPGTRLVLVGDADQLPSVGPGRVLADLIGSGAFPVTHLSRIFRQSKTSDIVVNAHRINQGKPLLPQKKESDFFFLERSDAGVILSHMIALIRDKLPPYLSVSPREIQVLTPMRKGTLGVEGLNRVLQKYLNPPKEGKAELESGDRIFREGDKVMQIRNDYQMQWEIRGKYGIPVRQGEGVFNGDIGVIRKIEPALRTVTVEFEEGHMAEYPSEKLSELEIGYAVTIHKSQGSEYPAVILPLLSGPSMLLTRNLLYTAVTRAKRLVIILGSSDTVLAMIRNGNGEVRYTSLGEQITVLQPYAEQAL